MLHERTKRMAVLVSGGPAPGINSVIAAATVRANLAGCEVIGIDDGFEWIMQGDISHVIPLDIDTVSRIHFRGGSMIGITRANPTKTEQTLEATITSLLRLNVDKLLTIGGDGTAAGAARLSAKSHGRIRVVHVPKTIDNDIDLPPHVFTFGFQTARHVGVELVKNLMVDAKTTRRWYFVVAMGRQAGHLALGIGKAAGATLSLIPEEFGDGPLPLSTLVDLLCGAVIKRLSSGRKDGIAVLAEGLSERLDPTGLEEFEHLERDENGRVRLSSIDLGGLLKAEVARKLATLGVHVTISAKNIGYELRCADPVPFDMDYTRDLGYCAARYLLEGGSGSIVSIQDERFVPIPFEKIMDPATGRSRVRMVDVLGDRYRIAYSYMVRLKHEDFDDPHALALHAATVGIPPEEFRARFEYLVSSPRFSMLPTTE